MEVDVQLKPQPGKAPCLETGDMVTAVITGLEPTTFYSASIRAKTDLDVYGPPLETKALFKTLPSAPQRPNITTTTTKTGIIVVSLCACTKFKAFSFSIDHCGTKVNSIYTSG